MSYIHELEKCEDICIELLWMTGRSGVEKRDDYIRHAVDNLRRVDSSLTTDESSNNTFGSLSYDLACYVDAMNEISKYLEGTIESEEKVLEIIGTITTKINRDTILERTEESIQSREVDEALISFARELRDRLNSPKLYHPIETLALIEYRLVHMGNYFKGYGTYPDKRIVEAIGAWYLMRGGMKLPDHKEVQQEKVTRVLLARKSTLKSSLRKTLIGIDRLRRKKSFLSRVSELWLGFKRPELQSKELPIELIDPWNISDSFARGLGTTTYNSDFVTNNDEEIDQLRRATGLPPEQLVVFRPERMAFQETIAAAVTRVRMEDPQQFIESQLFGNQQLYKKLVIPMLKEANLESEFEKFVSKVRNYVDYVMDDHFVIVNPNMEIRGLLAKHKRRIEIRINKNKYDPKLVETRSALQNLVVNDLARGYFQPRVRRIVDEAFDIYLYSKKRLALKLKSNHERLSFVTIGGPASGKTSMKELILIEYAELTGKQDLLCQIDSDHYKPILSKAQGGRTPGQSWSESDLVRQLAEDRLAEMIDRDGKAPDFWISTTTPKPQRVKMVSGEISKVIVYIVTCQVEGKTGAVVRAYNRAAKSGADFGRFIPTKELLTKHKYASRLIPKFFANRRIVRLFSTDSSSSTETKVINLFAKMDGHNRGLRVLDPSLFISFIKKSLINIEAKSESELYNDPLLVEGIANQIWKYTVNGISITFRYTDKVAPNPLHRKYDTSSSLGMVEENLQLHAVLISQPEAYFWAGHGRVEITDLETCLRVLGPEILIAILKKYSKHWSIVIRDYPGNLLLNVDFKKGVCNIAPDDVLKSTKLFVEKTKHELLHEKNNTTLSNRPS